MGILFGGPTPEDGASAYDIWIDEGHVGSPTDFLNWLKGAPGDSAYEVAVSEGFSGTVAAWLASLKGADGKSAYQVWQDNGHTGTQADFLNWLQADLSALGTPIDWDVTSGATAIGEGEGKYIKIGNLVLVTAKIRNTAEYCEVVLPYPVKYGFAGEAILNEGGIPRRKEIYTNSAGTKLAMEGSYIPVPGLLYDLAACYVTT